MKLIFISGPFRGANAWEVENNIRRAEALALSVWRLGAVAICPHTNTRFFSGALPDSTWLAGDIEILRRCDAVITTPDWQRSEGAIAEVGFALENGIPEFSNLEELEKWLQLQVEVDESRKTEQYFNPRLGPILEESLRDEQEAKRRMEENGQEECQRQADLSHRGISWV